MSMKVEYHLMFANKNSGKAYAKYGGWIYINYNVTPDNLIEENR